MTASHHKKQKKDKKHRILLGSIFVVISSLACGNNPASGQRPKIEAAPLGRIAGQWRVIAADTVKITVRAPGAAGVKFLYKPSVAIRRHAELRTLSPPADGSGNFSLEWRPGPDFCGDVWAEVFYPGEVVRRTEALSLATEASVTQGGAIPLDSIGNSVRTDESARSDKFTGGRITQAPLIAGDPRIWITVNVPAFRLTLWQNNKEVRTYQIGIGRPNFQLPIGERKAMEIVWNPEWIPPDSGWVEESEVVEIGERIEADDPRNPLGKIKIRLGGEILIHETAKRSDLGQLVSHGCVRMLTGDIVDLAEKIVTARRLPVSKGQIDYAMASTERVSVKLDPPVWVDINYDTQVVEGGVLHLYPDVYNRGTNIFETLRAELTGSGVDVAKLDDQVLRVMFGRVSLREGFRVNIADIKAGRALTAGLQLPLTNYSVERNPTEQPNKETGQRN
jgi:L,D-transpeptidase catalytic domain